MPRRRARLPTWFRWVMKRSTASPSPLRSTSDLLPPSDALRRPQEAQDQRSPPRRRGPRRRACFFVHPAPATNNSFASGRMVCSSALGA